MRLTLSRSVPKLLPSRRMGCPPSVLREVTPSGRRSRSITGFSYDELEAWGTGVAIVAVVPASSACQWWWWPVPEGAKHSMDLCGTASTQSMATNWPLTRAPAAVLPLTVAWAVAAVCPYVTLTTDWAPA